MLDWEALEHERISTYERQRGLFLVHTWKASTQPGQMVAVTAWIAQHRDGPLAQGKVKGVEYVWGPKFDEHSQVVTQPANGFAITVDLYGPLVLLARVRLTDAPEPLVLTRYVNFVEQSETEEIGALVDRFCAALPLKRDEREGLVQLLDHYRRTPHEPDPPLKITRVVLGEAPGRVAWRMSLAPKSAYSIQRDEPEPALEALKAVIRDELVPRMRWWDRRHGDGGALEAAPETRGL